MTINILGAVALAAGFSMLIIYEQFWQRSKQKTKQYNESNIL